MGMRIAGKVLQLAIGGVLGGIIGGIITGDENYLIVLAVGVPVLVTVAGVIGSLGVAKRVRAKSATAAGRPPGIISTMPEVAAETQKGAVLNPVSTARPSEGVVLNGQPVGKPAKANRPPATQAGAGRIAWRVLGIVTIVIGAALALIPAYSTITWIGSDIAAGRPFDGRDMRTGLHQQEAFDRVAALIGSTEVTSINFFDSYLAVSAPYPAGSRTVDRFVYKYGRASHDGPDYSQPDELRDELFEAGDIDMSIVAKLTRQSLDDANIEDVDGVYPSISRFGGDAPEISISISGVYFDAYYSYSLDGELIQRSGSAFE